ncbi:tRNA-queuosine alpha-mannosyltransferase domain-containing protein [Bremerella cremea]|uniref:tRNA-queuosine alpha-mannosyltransferase domain-containing protein n=1 Tax=Bremerella cremea TaxID=1031537 RepID=UPI0031E96C0D
MKILALEPYYGGSHRAFLDGWSQASRHDWTCLTLPAHHWKWRMRHAAITFAQLLHETQSSDFDLLFCTDMLNLAAFRGLAPKAISQLPSLLYFHENQLTYPDQFRTQRDYHYAFDNFQSMLSADAIWFNSQYHRDEFLQATRQFLSRFPDYQLDDQIDLLAQRCTIAHPGLQVSPKRETQPRFDCPHIVWAARWEQDKNPEDFFAALQQLNDHGVSFRLSVVGESFRDSPKIFAEAQEMFSDQIEQWGFLPSHADYQTLLRTADLFVSTAIHEFFGISAAEAILAGCIPVLPNRLAYPELVEHQTHLLYDGTPNGLASHIQHLTQDQSFQQQAQQQSHQAQQRLKNLQWPNLAPSYDTAAERITPQ